MANALTYWRKTNRLTNRCVRLGVGDTHACANHIGDFVCGLPAAFAPNTSDADRLSFAMVIITDVPSEIVDKVERRLAKPSLIEIDGVPRVIDRPRIYNLDIPLLKLEYPTLAAAIDKLFDPARTLAVNQIPELTWTKFRKAVWDKVGSVVVPEATWEVDPDG